MNGTAAAVQMSAHGGSTLALTLLAVGLALVVVGAYAWTSGITSRPRLRVSDPYCESRPMPPIPRPGQRVGSFAYIDVSNEPRWGDTSADNVRINLTFWDESGNRLFTGVKGRWAAEDDQPLRPQTGLRAPQISIPANGSAEPVDMAFKYRDEARWYVFNDDNRVVDPHELRHRELPGNFVYVRVQLIGSNVRATGWFRLGRGEPGSEMTIATTAARFS
ncbi:MAG: hypothetical protein NUW01_01680 [Gemmatimonadaceae bacterium]|nr:hypothetical protein [Gemmatimonadaceae bacterium]